MGRKVILQVSLLLYALTWLFASAQNIPSAQRVAELAGFKLEEIKKLKNTSDLLEAWPRIWKKRGLALPTVGDLWGILKDLKREDVIYAIAQNIGDDITVYEQTDVEGELLGTDATDPSFLQDSVSELYARVNEPEGSFDDQSQIRETTGSDLFEKPQDNRKGILLKVLKKIKKTQKVKALTSTDER